MKSILFFLMLALPHLCYGQSFSGSIGYEETDLNTINPNRMLLRTKSALAYGTKGSPYVFQDFKKGNVYYSNLQRISGISLNYDCHGNRLEYLSDGSVYLLNTAQVDFFEVDPGEDSSRLFQQVFVEHLKKRIFLQVLYNDSTILYKRYYKDFKEADYGGAYSQDRRYDEYQDRYSYYVKRTDTALQQLRPRKKSILEVLADRSEEIENFIKQEKTDLRTDDGLVRLIRFYDGLD
jgi:hypothetical protein